MAPPPPARAARRAAVAAATVVLLLPSAAFAQDAALPHAPTVSATPTTTLARADVGLRVDVRRRPGHAPVRSVDVALPDGLLGRLATVPFCSDDAARAGTCPPESRLGTAQLTVETPAGLSTLAGTLSLAGPNATTLARMVLSVRSALGRAVVRAPIRLGSRDGRVKVRLPIPATIGGTAVTLRRVTLDITRDGFLFNPSGCSGRTIDATVWAVGGAVALASAPYPVTGCSALAFAPGARLFNEDRQTRRRDSHPPLTVDLRPRASDAALREVFVGFPRHLQPNIELLQAVCNTTALEAGRCPPATQIATARATTPLIPDDLEGPVFLTFPEETESSGRGLELPTTSVMLEALNGLITLRLDGRLRLDAGRLVSEFTGLPDVPLSSFALDLRPGNFIATRSLCSPDFERADVRITGHNGATRALRRSPHFAACQRRPLVRVTMARVGFLRPIVRAKIEPPPRGGERIRRLNVTLPERLSVRRVRRGVSVRVGKRTLARKHWTLSRATKRLRIRSGLGRRGARRVRVVLRGGAVVAGPRTRRQARRGDLRLAFRVTVRDTAGKVTRRRAFGYDEAWRAPTG